MKKMIELKQVEEIKDEYIEKIRTSDGISPFSLKRIEGINDFVEYLRKKIYNKQEGGNNEK